MNFRPIALPALLLGSAVFTGCGGLRRSPSTGNTPDHHQRDPEVVAPIVQATV
jgi:hypothetical protein